MTELPKKYDPKESEKKWLTFWEENDTYAYDFDSSDETYVVDTPPPTVSGKMHLGHAFSYAQQDFNVRFQRMVGKNVYFPFGTDDNGLPTERLVEKTKKVKSTRMERSEFITLCNDTIKEIKPDFIYDWKQLGMSCDFKGTSYSTIDPYCIEIAQKSFIDLFNKDLVYQYEAPSMWCVNCQTAIAQAELEDEQFNSSFNDIEFDLVDSDKKILIATTRPELLPGCVCIFVHPEDDRYKDLVGKKAKVPIFGQEVPIFADESANPEKGSGILMICSYGDRFDVDAIMRHKLEPRVCFTKQGTLNSLAGEYEGLKIKDARKEILAKLEETGQLLDKKPITHAVNVHDKCGTEVEFLSTKQWFVKVVDFKDQIMEKGNEISWYPASMKKRFDNWVENLNWDWCISRQRHFGVCIPVWYCNGCGKPKVPKVEELPVDVLNSNPSTSCDCGCSDFTPETDVFDTWMTSSVSPQIIANWANNESKAQYKYDELFPNAMRPQAHDIIRTWAFYTIVKAMHHDNKIPWSDIVISGHVLDKNGNKMSKSKGNVVLPQSVFEKYGADAMRFWAAGSKLGEDLPFMEKDLVTGKKTIVKLWNATKFSLMHLQDYKFSQDHDVKLTEFDKYMLKKFYKLADECKEWISNYEYSKVKSAVEMFFFNDFCDHYLEIAKDRLYKPEIYGDDKRLSAQHALFHMISGCVKMFAPIMPFITEELYQAYFKQFESKDSIHQTLWPSYDFEDLELKNEALGDVVIKVVDFVRKYKSDNSLALNAPLDKITVLSKLVKEDLDEIKMDIVSATKAENVEFDVLATNDDVTDLMVKFD